jgi:hypothetical protein
LRLFISPVGVPSGTAEAGNAKHRDKLTSKLNPSSGLTPFSAQYRLAEAGGPSPPPATGPQHSLRSFAPAQATDRKTAPPTVFDRAPGEIIPDKLTVYRRDFLLRRGARVELSRRAGTALRPRRPPLRRAGGAARHANRTCRAQFAWTARLGDSFYFAQCEIVESLLRRGARWFERTGLKPAGLRFRRGGAPKGRLIGLAGKKASAMRAVYSTKPRRGLQYHKAVFADDLDAVDGE